MISIARLGGLPVLIVFGRCRIRTWGGRGRSARGFLCRHFPGCLPVGSLNVIITLSCGIPLGNPREVIKSVNFCNVVKSKKTTYHPMGRWGGATLGPFAFGDAVGFGGVTMAEDGLKMRGIYAVRTWKKVNGK